MKKIPISYGGIKCMHGLNLYGPYLENESQYNYSINIRTCYGEIIYINNVNKYTCCGTSELSCV